MSGTLRTRKRYEPYGRDVLGSLIQTNGISGYTSTPVYSPYTYRLRQETVDEIHPFHPKQGGPFEMRKYEMSFLDSPVVRFGQCFPDARYYQGLYKSMYESKVRSVLTMPTDSLPASQNVAATTYGTTAWSRFRPTKPVVSLGQFFGELRFMPRSVMEKLSYWKDTHKKIFKRGVKSAKFSDLGDLYLAWNFGWKPFLKDLRTWYASVKEVDRRIADLRRNNGKTVRRGGTLFKTETDQSYSLTGTNWQPGSSSYLINAVQKRIEHVTDHAWFKGAYRYYIPGLDSPKWGRLKALQVLYDVDITPTVLYELMPWSWLIDWYTNLGSVITNLTSQLQQNLSTSYAYLMYHKVTETRWTARMNAKLQISSSGAYTLTPIAIEASRKYETKTRVSASPFGFGLDPASLNAYQISILSALGLSRLRF